MQRVTKHRKKNKLRVFLLACFFLLVAAAAVLIWAFQIEPGLLMIKNYQVESDQLPQNWAGRRIGFITDIHSGPGYGSERLRKAVDKLMSENPDIIFFGGDLVDSSTPIEDDEFAREIVTELSRLEAEYGKYAVIGNHDNRLKAELEAAISWLEQAGFTVLINQAVMVDGVWIGGLDESYFGKPDLEETLMQPAKSSGIVSETTDDQADESTLYRIMLMHQPDYLPIYEDSDRKTDLDLIVSGHSHNGQITLFGHPLMKVYQGEEFVRGQYKPFAESDTDLIVSSGLGSVVIHARLFNIPELTIIELNSKN
ncbi:MAG: metallophosphoesterase [Eubacteriales bacterium]|nr:metallophosphoesterase [Eubacteriales bacterium]MDD3197193.1 metallophosphoesterase [Eubacteriales bacterium]MDD3502577.1 metallophosphoesterase [Eubacteriales bacterium]MDD4681699.1 metallophosphoesterase [Eubacteriales bacterium]